jgi:hypothetical protein
MNVADSKLPGWAVLELSDHRRLGGRVSFVEHGFVRIDIPIGEGAVTTQLYSPGAVYCITPTTEVVALSVAATSKPEPAC